MKGKNGNGDLGLTAVERVRELMQVDPGWSIAEERGFTWWGAWVRQRVWSDEAVASHGETLWQVRARTPALRDVPDEPETYRLLDALNDLSAMSAYVYDADDGTISARCGVFLYGEVESWLARFLQIAVALQPSIAWRQVPETAGGLLLDDAAHPAMGPRRDPDDMLTLAEQPGPGVVPFTPAVLHDAFVAFEADGVPVDWSPSGNDLFTAVPMGKGDFARWAIGAGEHPVLGPGAVVQLHLPGRMGRLRAAWIANALNAAESADWRGEPRPHGLGRWFADDGFLGHVLFCPAMVFGGGDPGGPDRSEALLMLRNFLAWDGARAVFAAARLPWLATAARSRFPDDEPGPTDRVPDPDAATGEDGPPLADAFEPATPGSAAAADTVGPAIPPWDSGSDVEAGVTDAIDLARSGRIADAVDATEATIAELRMKLRSVHQFRSAGLTELERWDEALTELDAALALGLEGDELVGTLGTRAWIAGRCGRPADGLADADRALAIGTDDDLMLARIRVNRGYALSLLGRDDEALEEYRAALVINPIEPLANYNVACQLSLRGQPDEAIKYLRVAVHFDPSLRRTARHDEDFANLVADTDLGDEFRALVGEDD